MRKIDADRLKAVLQNIKEHLEESGTQQGRQGSVWIEYAMEVVSEQPAIATPPNDPLTLDELREIVDQLELCGYECEGGTINMNKAFVRLKELAYRRKPEDKK